MTRDKRIHKGMALMRDIWRVNWREQRGWTLFAWGLCAWASIIMWFQSRNLWEDFETWERLALRLIAPVTVFAIPCLFYMVYSWWWTQRR